MKRCEFCGQILRAERCACDEANRDLMSTIPTAALRNEVGRRMTEQRKKIEEEESEK